MSVQVNCPHCLTPCEIPDHQADKVLSCGNCQKTFRLKTPAPKPPTPQAPPSPAANSPAKPRPSHASGLAKAPKPAAAPKAAPKKAPEEGEMLEVVDDEVLALDAVEETPKKRTKRTAGSPLRDLPTAEAAQPAPKKKRSSAMLILGCLGVLGLLFVGGVAAAGAGVWFLRPDWLGLAATNPLTTTPNGPQPTEPKDTKPAADAFAVVSDPPRAAERDKPYTYQVAVKSGKAPLKFKLDTGPPAMALSATGQLTWTVPADYDKPEAAVTLHLSDASGQQLDHTFKIKVPAKPVVVNPADPPPLLKEEKLEVALPSPAEDVCLGAGGRFIILSLPREQKLAVFDVNEKKVVKYLPLGEDGAKFAAGADKLFVVFPSQSVLQRWDLRNFEKETTVPLPFKGTAVELCMGNASQGPLLVCLKEPDEVGKSNVKFLDPATLKPIDIDWQDPERTFNGPGLRASADGTVFAAQQGWRTATSVALKGKRAKVYTAGMSTTLAAPSADGRSIYTSQEVCTTELKTVFKPENPGNFITLPFVPSQQGDFFMRLEDPSFLNPPKKAGDIKFFIGGHQTPFATWKDFDGVFGQALYAAKALTADQRYLLLPDANLLVNVPAANDRLVLYRFDVDDLLAKSGKDYLIVTSSPAKASFKDRTFTYQMAVKSKKGGVKYKLDTAPPGMKVSPDGKITWDVPANFADAGADVILTVSDDSSQERSHSFKINVGPLLVTGPTDTNPTPGDLPKTEPVVKTDKLVNPPGIKLEIKPAKLAQDATALTLPSSVGQTCVGGGGRFLIFHLPKEKEGQLAVFDVNEARVIKKLPVGDDKVFFAAGMTKLLVVLTEKNVLQRWSLLTFERELTVPLPVKGAVQAVAMGAATAGPLVVGTAGDTPADSGVVFLDIQTLKEIPVEKAVGDNALAFDKQAELRVSADGSLLNVYHRGINGVHSVLLSAAAYQGFFEPAPAGDAVPGPDGKTVFTSNGLYTARLKKLNAERRSGVPLPALQGDLYVTVVPAERAGANKNASLSFHLPGDGRALFTLTNVDGLDLADRAGVPGGGAPALPLDKRVFLVPQANLLAVLSSAGDRLCLQRFDLETALDKSGTDYLVVTSPPEGAASRGAPFEHQLVVKSKKGGVKYRLGTAPKEMKLSPEGKLTWDVPADFATPEAEVVVNVGDASGQEIAYHFKVAVALPAKPVTAGAAPFEIKAPALKGDHEERPLTSATDEVCLGGGGRFVLLSLPKEKKVAVFDVNEAKEVAALAVGEDGFKIAAGMDKVFVAVPAKSVIQRWSLRTFEKEDTQPLPFKATLLELCAGYAAHGPVLAAFKESDGKSNIRYIDPDTLKPAEVEFGDKQPVFYGRHLRASADGGVFAASIDPQHINVLELNGKNARSHVLAAVTNLAWPSPDGHTLYTATDAFAGPDYHSLKLDNPGAPVTLPFVPARQGDLFLRLDDHVTRELMKNPKTPPAQLKEGGDVHFYLPGQRTPFATWKDFDGVFGQKLLAGAKSLAADERYILLPQAGVLISVPASNDKLVLHRFDLDDLLSKYDKDYLFVASSPVTTAQRGNRYTYPVVVKSKKPGVVFQLAKAPPGMKLTTDGKLTWDVPADFAAGEAEVVLNVSEGPSKVVQTFRIAVER